MEEKAAERIVRNNDEARASYYNHYTGEKWGEAHHYHLSVNSSIGIERCIELILHIKRAKDQAKTTA